MAKLEQFEFPLNLFARISLGEIKVENNELIQVVKIKKTLLFCIFEFIAGIKKWLKKHKK